MLESFSYSFSQFSALNPCCSLSDFTHFTNYPKWGAWSTKFPLWRETLFSLERNSAQPRTSLWKFFYLSTDDAGCLKGLRSWHWGLRKTSEVRWDEPWPQALLTYVGGCMRPWHEQLSHETLHNVVQTIWMSSYCKYLKSSSSKRLPVQPIHLNRI